LSLRAQPATWNAFGNVRGIEAKLPPGWQGTTIPDAIHIDPEWPTDFSGQMLIGTVSEERRGQFVQLTVGALKKNLLPARTAAVP
jgi:hypothetical protein